ncbi:hypothetical protein [Halobacterium zhouii]|uniref:hypothetical protein n=1 Tax=Halobacterium zhouii TaxID=2902624 RepID=UPI001E391027|nr:hypothetical protein [Halobacterium zhouii]
MRTRRDLLATAGVGLAALAGCSRFPNLDAPSSTRSNTTTPTDTTGDSTTVDSIREPTLLSWGETATIDGTAVTPRATTVQHSAFYQAYPDALGVFSFGNRRALFVTVTVQGDDPRPAPEDFAVITDETVQAWTTDGDSSRRLPRDGQPYERDTRVGWLRFDLSAPVSASQFRVQFGGESEGAVHWSLPDDAVAALQAPPPVFSVTEFSAPDTVPRDESIPVSATVENRGDGAGTFRAAFNQAGPLYWSDPVSFALEPGESREWNTLVTTHQEVERADTVSFALITADDRLKRTVEITDA